MGRKWLARIDASRKGIMALENHKVTPGIQGANLVHHRVLPTIRQFLSKPIVTVS
jgi:hypothetical protein